MAASTKPNPDAELNAFLERKAINTAPPWLPEPGTVMAAEVIGLRMGQDTGYGPYPIVVYKKADGEYVAVHAFHTLLRERLRELGTNIGKRQILSYDGKRKKTNATDEEREKGRDEYHFYYVENAGEETLAGKDEDFTF